MKTDEIRKKLALNTREFSLLLGVHQSTVYRWESNPEEPINEPQATLIAALGRQLSDQDNLLELQSKLKDGLRFGGMVTGLSIALKVFYPSDEE